MSQVCHWNRFRVFDGSPRPVPGAEGGEGQRLHEGQGQSRSAGDDNDRDGDDDNHDDDTNIGVDDYKANHVQHLSFVFMSHLLLLGKFEYSGGPIFKVVLEC